MSYYIKELVTTVAVVLAVKLWQEMPKLVDSRSHLKHQP